jgi:hypothetical protein
VGSAEHTWEGVSEAQFGSILYVLATLELAAGEVLMRVANWVGEEGCKMAVWLR